MEGGILEELLPARTGSGPLLQRDYWAVIRNSRMSPREIAALVSARFPEFAPADVVVFRRQAGREGPLEPGEELSVHIRFAGDFRVRVLHRDANSVTLGTLAGHPEAGRITFGAYRNQRGDVIFHIRSRARSSSDLNYAGFLAMGEALQTSCWADFVASVALTAGEGLLGFVHAETAPMSSDEEEAFAAHKPTYLARGD